MVLELLQSIVRIYWEIVLLIPMPWRAGLTFFIVGFLVYWLVWRLFPWVLEKSGHLLLFLVESIASLLLLPEYLITNQLRQHGYPPLPGFYGFGDILQGTVSFIYSGISSLGETRKKMRQPSKMWVILIATVPIALWYARPYLEDTLAVNYIDRGIAWWYVLEEWALTRG
ncbi:MAG: hypothetical protein MN733_09530 [Nitrososphaera sp.]|nr:hypothetical protein [Nitrososphaera sp.]